MPRRNRNAGTPAINTDLLSGQARQLANELRPYPVVVLIDEAAYYYAAGTGISKTGHYGRLLALIHKYLAEGAEIYLTDAKSANSHAA